MELLASSIHSGMHQLGCHMQMELQLTFEHSNAGGGGERVLWAAIRATQIRWPKAKCVVYTGDHEATKDEILERVKVCT